MKMKQMSGKQNLFYELVLIVGFINEPGILGN